MARRKAHIKDAAKEKPGTARENRTRHSGPAIRIGKTVIAVEDFC
jgi:hypothetical protein